MLADSRSSFTSGKCNISLHAGVETRRVMHKIWTGWRSLNKTQLQKGIVVKKKKKRRKSLLDWTCSSNLNGLSCPSKTLLHIFFSCGCSRAGSVSSDHFIWVFHGNVANGLYSCPFCMDQ